MFIKFSESKAHYEKGQAFPFVIAIIAVIIIMAMVTANLGKLAIFKTDVSNAADSGALAGASVLSGYLLGLGLLSDTWCGKGVVVAARMLEIIALGRDDINVDSLMGSDNAGSTSTVDNGDGTSTTTTYDSTNTRTDTTYNNDTGEQTNQETDSSMSYQRFGPDLVGAIRVYIPHIIQYIPDYIQAMLDGQMAWANAKQTALRYAFNNSGVDEQPNVQFKHYDDGSGTAYDNYLNTFLAQEANQTGFSRFMNHPLSGFWNNNGTSLPTVEPDMDLPPVTITSGYGWQQEADESFSSSYPGNNWRAKDNYVEVEVRGSIMYPIEMLSFTDYFGAAVANTLTAIATIGAFCKYVGWTGEGDPVVKALIEVYGLGYLLAFLYACVAGAAYRGMIENMPVGFTFPDRDMERQTTNNPIQLKVTRHKKSNELGIWNFQYGNVVAKSAARTFPDDNPLGDVTVEPVLIEGMRDLGNFLGQYSGSISEGNFASPEMIETIVRGLLCMGMVATMGGLLAAAAGDIIDEAFEDAYDCDWDDDYDECAAKLAAAVSVESVFAGGMGAITSVILQYLIYQLLCNSSNSIFQPDVGDADMDTDALANQDPNDWFTTSLHLFETELSPGYLQ